MTFVYWLFDDKCFCPWKHGYVGVTCNLRNRLKHHRANRREKFKHRVLFEGSEQECFALEVAMRPKAYIGWNYAFGGEGGSRQPRTSETRQKMRDAALRRYADPAERIKMSKVQTGRIISWGAKISAGKKGWEPSDELRARWSVNRKGRKFGPMSEAHKANLSAAKKGKPNPKAAEANRKPRGKNLYPRSAEHCAKIAASKQNLSLETRMRMSIAAKQRDGLRQKNEYGRYI